MTADEVQWPGDIRASFEDGEIVDKAELRWLLELVDRLAEDRSASFALTPEEREIAGRARTQSNGTVHALLRIIDRLTGGGA